MDNKEKLIKVKKITTNTFFVILMYVVLAIFLSFFIWSLSTVKNDISKNVFEFKSLADYYMVFMWLLSGIVPVILILKKRKDVSRVSKYYKTLLIFQIVVFFPSAIFILFKKQSNSIEYIQQVILMTKAYFFILVFLLLIGIGITIYMTRSELKKNNWWLFILSIPYILLGWNVQKDFINFNNFINNSNFDIEKVQNMLNETNGDIWLINDFFYKGIAVPILILIIVLGMMIIENIWKKRQRNNKVKEK